MPAPIKSLLSQKPATFVMNSDRYSAYHRTMEDLPNEILRLIARQVLGKEEGMQLWCKLASTCTRLWSFQLPAEPLYLLDDKLNKQGPPCYRHAHA